jgi:superfamily II DNA/RNA helicase
MFSVTFSKEVQALAAGYMEDYIILKTSVCGTNEDVKQIFYHCGSNVKIFKLMEILNDEVREKKAIVFVESKNTADYVAAILCNYSIQVCFEVR